MVKKFSTNLQYFKIPTVCDTELKKQIAKEHGVCRAFESRFPIKILIRL